MIEGVAVPKGAKRDPLVDIHWIPADQLRANHYNPNRVFKLELELLERSLLSLGWIQPILTTPDGLIIDGFHRWRLSQDSPAVMQRYKGIVPAAFLDVDEPHAMAITVRINRAKGTHSAIGMSELAHAIVNEHGWSRERLAEEIGAHIDEVDLLLQENVFTLKRVQHWAYSQAWYPAPSGDDSVISEPERGGYGDKGISNLEDAVRAGAIPAHD